MSVNFCDPPLCHESMVPQEIAFALYQTIAEVLYRSQADLVSINSESKTTQVLLQNRIAEMDQKSLRTWPTGI